jgi:hypothetical protein
VAPRTLSGAGVRILVTVPSRGTITATAPVDAYIAGLGRALSGPRRKKADLLAEARDALIDATEAFEEADGLSRWEAEQQAVADFGELATVVPGYRAELGYAQGRRTAVLLCLVMLAQPVIWQEGAWPWNQHDDGSGPVTVFLNQFVELAGVLSIIGALLAIVACGAGVRFQAVRDRATRVTGIFTLLSCALVGVTAVCMALSGSPSSSIGPGDMIWVTSFVLAPLGLVSFSARRCLRLA